MENTQETQKQVPSWLIVVAWLWAGLPLAWGVWQTLQKAAELFK